MDEEEVVKQLRVILAAGHLALLATFGSLDPH